MSTSALLAAKRPATLTGCNAVAQWVTQHEQELPRTYGEIIRYPANYRKAIQAKLPWTVRREMWLTQFKLYSESELLAPNQRTFVRAAMVPFSEMLDVATPQARREHIGDSLNVVASTVLGRDLHHAIFFVLGPDDPKTVQSVRTASFFLAALRRPARVPLVDDSNCNCHQLVNGPECSGSGCKDATCTISQGCGTGGVYSCNGRCNDADQ